MSVAVPSPLRYLGYANYTDIAAAKNPNSDAPATGAVAPAGTNYFTMTPLTQDVVCTFDGSTTPTATVGVRFRAGQTYAFDNCRTLLANMKIIQQAATASVNFGWFEGAS